MVDYIGIEKNLRRGANSRARPEVDIFSEFNAIYFIIKHIP